MKKLFLILLFGLISLISYSQVINFTVRFNSIKLIQISGNNYTLNGTIIDPNNIWGVNNVLVGDSLFYLEENIIYPFVITSKNGGGQAATFGITSVPNLLSTSPNYPQTNLGSVIVARPNAKGYCAIPASMQNLPISFALINRFQNKLAGDVIRATEIYKYIGIAGVLPSVNAFTAQATIAQNSAGELYSWSPVTNLATGTWSYTGSASSINGNVRDSLIVGYGLIKTYPNPTKLDIDTITLKPVFAYKVPTYTRVILSEKADTVLVQNNGTRLAIDRHWLTGPMRGLTGDIASLGTGDNVPVTLLNNNNPVIILDSSKMYLYGVSSGTFNDSVLTINRTTNRINFVKNTLFSGTPYNMSRIFSNGADIKYSVISGTPVVSFSKVNGVGTISVSGGIIELVRVQITITNTSTDTDSNHDFSVIAPTTQSGTVLQYPIVNIINTNNGQTPDIAAHVVKNPGSTPLVTFTSGTANSYIKMTTGDLTILGSTATIVLLF